MLLLMGWTLELRGDFVARKKHSGIKRTSAVRAKICSSRVGNTANCTRKKSFRLNECISYWKDQKKSKKYENFHKWLKYHFCCWWIIHLLLSQAKQITMWVTRKNSANDVNCRSMLLDQFWSSTAPSFRVISRLKPCCWKPCHGFLTQIQEIPAVGTQAL